MTVSYTHLALLSIKDGELQYETALQIFDGNLTVRETEKLVKKLLEEPKPSKKEDVEINKQLQIIYEQYEEKLKNKLGTKVKINQKNNGKGKDVYKRQHWLLMHILSILIWTQLLQKIQKRQRKSMKDLGLIPILLSQM